MAAHVRTLLEHGFQRHCHKHLETAFKHAQGRQSTFCQDWGSRSLVCLSRRGRELSDGVCHRTHTHTRQIVGHEKSRGVHQQHWHAVPTQSSWGASRPTDQRVDGGRVGVARHAGRVQPARGWWHLPDGQRPIIGSRGLCWAQPVEAEGLATWNSSRTRLGGRRARDIQRMLVGTWVRGL